MSLKDDIQQAQVSSGEAAIFDNLKKLGLIDGKETMSEKIVGHKTFWNDDGTHRHEPLTESEADEIFKQAETEAKRRKEAIPDEETALRLMMGCCIRLREMGWTDPPKYTTKPGIYKFKVIELESTGIFDVTCDVGNDGYFKWWHASHGDVWAITPLMVKSVTNN